MKKKARKMAPADEFLKISKTLWGRRWRVKVAAALHVHPTTVWRWMQKDCEPPMMALTALKSIAEQKLDAETKQA